MRALRDRLRYRLHYRLKRIVFKLSPALAERLKLDFRLNVPNRVFLEQSVFAYLNELACRARHPFKTLFVGIDKHNWHYPRLLTSEFHSLDIEPRMAVYGPSGRHWTGCATMMGAHYGRNVFDVVVANGLVGFGVNGVTHFRRLMEQCQQVLKPGGVLIVGYNDQPDRAPFAVLPAACEYFQPFVPPIAGVNSVVHRMNDSFDHVFVFVRKMGTSEDVAAGAAMEAATQAATEATTEATTTEAVAGGHHSASPLRDHAAASTRIPS